MNEFLFEGKKIFKKTLGKSMKIKFHQQKNYI